MGVCSASNIFDKKDLLFNLKKKKAKHTTTPLQTFNIKHLTCELAQEYLPFPGHTARLWLCTEQTELPELQDEG